MSETTKTIISAFCIGAIVGASSVAYSACKRVSRADELGFIQAQIYEMQSALEAISEQASEK